jgi:AcrR family transcriptional regulator
VKRTVAEEPALAPARPTPAGRPTVRRRNPGRRTQLAIHDAAVKSFAAKGYAGTSLRSLAAEVGVEVGSLYRHFASKEELLFNVVKQASDEFYQTLTETLANAPARPVARLRALTEETARYHAVHGAQSFVGTAEVRELTRLHHKHVMKQRSLVDSLFKSVVEECIAAGYFPADTNPSVASNFVISVATGVALWYNPAGPIKPDQVAALVADFAVPDTRSHARRAASPRRT